MNCIGCGKEIPEGAFTADVEGSKVHLTCYSRSQERFDAGGKILKILTGHTGEDCIVIMAFCVAKIAAQGVVLERRERAEALCLDPDKLFEVMTGLLLTTSIDMFGEMVERAKNKRN